MRVTEADDRTSLISPSSSHVGTQSKRRSTSFTAMQNFQEPSIHKWPWSARQKIPKSLDDFLPISLIGCIYKILLANKLKAVLPSLISPCQTAFLLHRQIFDGVLIINEIMNRTIITCKSSHNNWWWLKSILRVFEMASRLKLNFHRVVL